MSSQNIPKVVQELLESVNTVIHGKEHEVRMIISCWLAGGHVLLEDVPGTGKTVLAKTLAKILCVTFGRVQFTPDLLPADILGSTLFDKSKNAFYFRPGPIFCTFLLADEINRATPRTQSALLEAMAERQVTIDGKASLLPANFLVLATQNPIEHHGTFPLPQAQLDRFFIRLSLGHPSVKDELKMLRRNLNTDPLSELSSIVSEATLSTLFTDFKKVEVSDAVLIYIQSIVEKTRSHKDVNLGAGPRAGIALAKLAQTWAYTSGEKIVTPAHVYELLPYVLGHRIIPTPKARMEGKSGQSIVSEIVKSVKVPTR